MDTRNDDLDAESVQRFLLGNDINEDFREPLTDALVYEPLPYRSAIAEGATHVVMLRSRPDGVDVTGKSTMHYIANNKQLTTPLTPQNKKNPQEKVAHLNE